MRAKFVRSDNDLKNLGIGILTFDKLEVGDILESTENVYPDHTRLTLDFYEEMPTATIGPKKLFVISDVKRRENILEMGLRFAGFLNAAVNLRKRMLEDKWTDEKLPHVYRMIGSVNEWKGHFKILQPKEYES